MDLNESGKLFDGCLSPEPHPQNVTDRVGHYFSCLKDAQRQEYFDIVSDDVRDSIRHREESIRNLSCALKTNAHGKDLIEKFRRAFDYWRSQRGQVNQPTAPELVWTGSDDPSAGDYFQAKIICFQDNGDEYIPTSIAELRGTFPHQQIPVNDLVGDTAATKTWLRRGGMIRYIHLPANNMSWAENVISRYGKAESHKQHAVLRPEVWRASQHGGRSDPIHSRFMKPRCIAIARELRYSKHTESDTALFMPYMHWETDHNRVKQSRIMKKQYEASTGKIEYTFKEVVDLAAEVHESYMSTRFKSMMMRQPKRNLGRVLLLAAQVAEAMQSYRDELLLKDFLFAGLPLHPRRTLDQHSLWTLKNTERQDTNQVVHRATKPNIYHETCAFARQGTQCRECRHNSRQVTRVIMVDQLWLWVLNDELVITCFPQGWGDSSKDPSGIHKGIRYDLQRRGRAPIESVHDIVYLILDRCCGTFFNLSRTSPGKQPQLVEIFANAIGTITYRQIHAYDKFLDYIRVRALRILDVRLTTGKRPRISLLTEVQLLQEIKDILDELKIMSNIKHEQLQVVRSFINVFTEQTGFVVGTGKLEDRPQAGTSLLKLSQIHKMYLTLAESIQDHITELKRLSDNASDTSASLNELLALKQQQMGVVEASEEAAYARKQQEETVQQGRSIMIFTIVTIVFLPLSFCASIFGMNNQEFSGGNLTLRQELIYMFPTSIAVMLITLLIAAKVYGFPVHPFGKTEWYRDLKWSIKTRSAERQRLKELKKAQRRELAQNSATRPIPLSTIRNRTVSRDSTGQNGSWVDAEETV